MSFISYSTEPNRRPSHSAKISSQQLRPQRPSLSDRNILVVDDNTESAPTLFTERAERRQLYNVPKTPFYGYNIPSTPPHCHLDPRSANCQVPPTQAPVAILDDASMLQGQLLLTTCLGGILMAALVLWCCIYARQSRRTTALRRQQEQLQQRQASIELDDMIPEAERRRQMEGKLKLIRPEDIIIALGSGGGGGEDEYKNCCCICLNDFDSSSGGDTISGSLNTDCRHYFHTECILQAFLQRPKTHYECPVCRRDFFPIVVSSSPDDIKQVEHRPGDD